jgi:hypothetical protein
LRIARRSTDHTSTTLPSRQANRMERREARQRRAAQRRVDGAQLLCAKAKLQGLRKAR